MSKQDQILDFVRLKGPVLPIHVAKEANLSMLFAGAYLAELVSSKKVILSKLKVGTSPLYYIQGQEAKLQNFTKHLDNKEQAALNDLRDNKILHDSELEPAIRVALRNIPDFAVPVKVNLKSGSELYWKWYLVPNNEAEIAIRELLNKKIIEENNEPEPVKEEPNQEIKETEPTKIQSEEEQIKTEKVELKEEKDLELKKQEIEQKTVESEQQKNIETEKEQKKRTIKKPKQKQKKKTVQRELTNISKLETSIEVEDPFYEKIKTSFEDKGIMITDCNIISEGKELDLVVQIPTVIGDLTYFCKAKKKVRSTEQDIFTTILQAQQKGLPALFVSTGSINKKAKEILNSQAKNVQFMSIK